MECWYPQLVRQGTKITVVQNWGDACRYAGLTKTSLAYALADQLGTSVEIQGDELLMKGRFDEVGILHGIKLIEATTS